MNPIAHTSIRPRLIAASPAVKPVLRSEPAPAPAPATGAVTNAQAQQIARIMAPIVHEMRNFLSPMRLSIEILRKRAAGDESAERAVEMLVGQTQGLARMVADLLDTSRIATGKLSLRVQQCVLQDVAWRAVEMCRPAAQDRAQHLVLHCVEAPVTVLADPLRLCQALANLIFNAQRYAHEGACIRIEAAAEGGSAILRVTDDGAGMTPETAAHAFDLYAQARPGEEDGLGIGLYLVKSIAELHGGRVSAASDGPGKGSTFTIALPMA